jgi:CP family cyanate transporter-like MFS transporter
VKALPRLALLAALLLAAVNLRPGITSLAPLIERIAEELALSRGLISLTTALPVLCMGLLAPLAPRLAVRFGLERTVLGCLLLIALALMLRAFGHSSGLLIGSAALVGMGIAVAGPLLSGFIKRHFVGQVGQIIGWYSLGMTIGGTVGAVLTLPVTQLLGGDWAFGLAFWTLPALLAALLWLRVPNVRESAHEAATGGLPWRVTRAWLVTGFFALQAGLFYALATWLVARYHEAGLSVLRSNTLFSLFMMVGLVSAFVLPWLTQRFGNRYLLLMGCSLSSALCLGMITFAPGFLPELWALLLGLSLTGSFALSMSLPLFETDTPLEVSRWTAMMLFVGYCLSSLTPVLAGLGRDLAGSYRLPFLVLTLLALLMSFLAWRLKASPRSAAPQAPAGA